MGKGFHYPTLFCVNYLFLSLCNYSSQFTSCNWCFLSIHFPKWDHSSSTFIPETLIMCAHYANSFIKDLWIVKYIYSTLQTGNSFRIKMKVKVTQSCPIHCNSMHFTVQCMEFHTVQCMEFFRPKQWSGFPSPWDLPNPGIKPRSL